MNANEKHEKALKTFQIIAALLESDLEVAEIRRRRAEILARYEISERTLRRYLKTYRDGGFESLMPKSRSDCGLCRAIDDHFWWRRCNLKKNSLNVVSAVSSKS